MVSSNSALGQIERKLLIEKYGRWLWFMRHQPDHATHWLAGIFIPPHERLWLRNMFAGYKENNVVASRGTSKSFSHASLGAPLKATLFRNVGILTVSASGFRGGQELFRDVVRLFKGQLKSQEVEGSFLERTASRPKIISRQPSIWTLEVDSFSRYATVPTNNADAMRGLRANIAIIDERNTFDDETVRKVIRPMLNVGQDFRRTASGGDSNQVFQVSTIDYTVRGWYPEIEYTKRLAEREYKAVQARKRGDWDEYDRLMEEDEGALKDSSFTYSQVDYTDLIVPTRFKDNEGKWHTVNFPLPKGVEEEDILRYDPSDGQSYYYLYPVDKKGLEEPLRSGTSDEEMWMAEQRNRFITSAGNVFSYDLIQKVAERPVYEDKEIPGYENNKKNPAYSGEWFVPVMYKCGDPCVLGVDVARESDETTFVVIRLGEMAKGKFTPSLDRLDEKDRPMLGKTPWNAIIWAEYHRNMESADAAEKVREMIERYNIVYAFDRDGKPIAGIGMDKRGGGGSVRDDLGNPKPTTEDGRPDPTWNWDDVLKVYDPEDEKGFAHYKAYDDPTEYWGGLALLATTNADNVEWTYGARGLMQKKKLYIAYWMPPSRMAFERGLTTVAGQPDRSDEEFLRLQVGYDGVRRLKDQLLKLQVKRTETGVIRFVMPGDSEKAENKKDLYSAMIYAVHMAREHLRNMTVEEQDAPMVDPVVVEIGSAYKGGRGRGGDVRQWRTIT